MNYYVKMTFYPNTKSLLKMLETAEMEYDGIEDGHFKIGPIPAETAAEFLGIIFRNTDVKDILISREEPSNG